MPTVGFYGLVYLRKKIFKVIRRIRPSFTDENVFACIPEPVNFTSLESNRFTRSTKERRLTGNLGANFSAHDSQAFLLQEVNVHGRAGTWLNSVLDLELTSFVIVDERQECYLFAGAIIDSMGICEFHYADFFEIITNIDKASTVFTVHIALRNQFMVVHWLHARRMLSIFSMGPANMISLRG